MNELAARKSSPGSPSPAAPSPGAVSPGAASPGTRVEKRSCRRGATQILLGMLAVVFLAGCDSTAGVGGTGELVIAAAKLHEISTIDPDHLPATQPTTKPTTAPAELNLTIEDVRRDALANNLDLRVELVNPTIARESLGEEQARFESTFFADGSLGTTDQPTASTLTSASAKDIRGDVGLTIPLRTGGQIQLTLPVDRFSTNNAFSTLNPAYTSDFAASLNVPLLRGAGTYYNTQSIRVAFYNYQQVQARTKLAITRVLADADRVYWRLFAARQEREVREQEYKLATAQLERSRRRIGAGADPGADITRAESGVADSVEAIVNTKNSVRQRERDLKRVLNRVDLPMESATVLLPTSPPDAHAYQLDAIKLADVALKQRMEMLDLELQLASDTSYVAVARNDLLPLVNLTYTYNVSGLGKTIDDSFRLLGEKRFEDHSVGLHVEVPIGNEVARSRLRRVLAARLQTLATRDQRIASIRQEVFDAADTLETNWERILAAQARVAAAARVVDTETRAYAAGLRTSTEVLDAQTKLADAQLARVSAVADYQISQVDIAFATGTLLGATKVSWQPAPVPRRHADNVID